MNFAPYRLVLRQPGVWSLLLFGLLSRVPATAAGMVVTLHVITSLHLGYAQAGIAGAAGMAGVGLGSPLAGALIDRLGLRPVLIATAVAQGCYWVAAPSLGYQWLIVCAFASGLLSIPLFTVMRQFLAAMVPEAQRRTIYSLDSMSVELSYMTGPALAVAGVTVVGSDWTMYGVGAGLVASALVLIVRNPPIRSDDEQAAADAQAVPLPRRQWLTPGLLMVLVATAATTITLYGSELAVVASLRESAATQWTGLVIGIWCAYSLIGGFIYGGMRRSVSPLLLVAGLGALTVPVALVGLIDGGWRWLVLALLPAGLLCAPAITATVNRVSSLAPATARGEAMGLHAAALTLGVGLGAPAAGAVIDAAGPSWGFVLAGGGGLLLALLAATAWPRTTRSPAQAVAAPHSIDTRDRVEVGQSS